MKEPEATPRTSAFHPVVFIVAIAAAFGIGLLVGRKGPALIAEKGPVASAPAPPVATAAVPGAPAAPPASPVASEKKPARTAELTPAELARRKNVPAILEDSDGNYELVAVIEGLDANQKLAKHQRLISAQRQQLLNLSRKFDQLPADATQQRELVAGEINSIRQGLGGNLKYMARNFGYSLRFNYHIVPHEAALYEVIGAGEGREARSELVHRFENAGSYQGFKRLREAYVLASVAAAAAEPDADDTAVETGEPDAAPAPVEENQYVGELDTIRKQLIADYRFDPEKDYQINMEKTALYARPAGR